MMGLPGICHQHVGCHVQISRLCSVVLLNRCRSKQQLFQRCNIRAVVNLGLARVAGCTHCSAIGHPRRRVCSPCICKAAVDLQLFDNAPIRRGKQAGGDLVLLCLPQRLQASLNFTSVVAILIKDCLIIELLRIVYEPQ